MSYGNYRNSGIRVITRYEEALNRLTKTRPIAGSGRNAGVIPLGHRSKAHYQLRMRQDESIACRLYRTDVVVFDKDGTITLNSEGYSTITTAAFIFEVLGVDARQYDNRLIVSVADGQYQVDKLKLRNKVGGWAAQYEVIESAQDVVHNIDRKVMNGLRRDTQDFRKFLSGLMKIKDYTFTDEELNEVSIKDNGSLALDSLWRHDARVVTERHTKFNELVKSGDAENWHTAAMWLCASARYSMWDKKFDPRKVMDLLDDILIALNPTVLVAKQLEAGVIKRDAYARFKPFMGER